MCGSVAGKGGEGNAAVCGDASRAPRNTAQPSCENDESIEAAVIEEKIGGVSGDKIPDSSLICQPDKMNQRLYGFRKSGSGGGAACFYRAVAGQRLVLQNIYVLRH